MYPEKKSLGKSLKLVGMFGGVAFAVFACGQMSNKKFDKPVTDEKARTGCIQGVILDGLTSKRVQGSILSTSATSKITVMARNEILKATPGPVASTADDALNADYAVCGIPLDESFPISVSIDEYQSIEGYVEVQSTDAWVSVQGDVVKPFPVKVVNLELFKKGTAASDYTVNVAYDGAPVNEATVYLKPTGANIFRNATSYYLQPVNQRTEALSVKTDSTGAAKFSKADLVLGSTYEVKIVPPSTNTDAAILSTSLIVGYLSSNAVTARTPYGATFELPTAQPSLTIVSNSSTDSSYDTDGKLTITFNRDIEIVPGTLDNVTATLNNALTAVIQANVANNNACEQASITVSGRTLTVKPVFSTQPVATRELGLEVVYSNIKVRPKSGPGSDTATTVAATTVKFYGGTNLP